ncbi:Rossmann-like domain-containing protein [Chloroflexota bacterium]
MRILDQLISTLTVEASVKDIRQGPFQTAVLARGCGLASTPHEAGPHQDKSPVKEAGGLIGKTAVELTQMAYSESALEAAIGMATINSLLEIDERHCVEVNAGDLLAEKGRGKRVALVGHFPFVPKLRSCAKELWVIERQPQQRDFVEDKANNFIPQADVVGITGMAFTNHTIEHLLGLCRKDAYVIVLGPTTPLSPVLFEYRVDAVSGVRVIEPDSVLLSVSQGATFRQIKGIRLLTVQR